MIDIVEAGFSGGLPALDVLPNESFICLVWNSSWEFPAGAAEG
jgi:hypothetical protein